MQLQIESMMYKRDLTLIHIHKMFNNAYVFLFIQIKSLGSCQVALNESLKNFLSCGRAAFECVI
jgi:hypothetical protein